VEPLAARRASALPELRVVRGDAALRPALPQHGILGVRGGDRHQRDERRQQARTDAPHAGRPVTSETPRTSRMVIEPPKPVSPIGLMGGTIEAQYSCSIGPGTFRIAAPRSRENVETRRFSSGRVASILSIINLCSGLTRMTTPKCRAP